MAANWLTQMSRQELRACRATTHSLLVSALACLESIQALLALLALPPLPSRASVLGITEDGSSNPSSSPRAPHGEEVSHPPTPTLQLLP